MEDIEIEIPDNVFLPCYQGLIDNESDIVILWGGRDSGKSRNIAQKLVIECMTNDYFRCILIKKTAISIKDSQWQLIKDICSEWGISHLFDFKSSPLEIKCKVNDNKFIARGCDEPERIKSINNPSHVWYEEGNQLTEADYLIVSTTLRSNKARVREYMSLNPECDGNYEDFWLYKMFFEVHYPTGMYTFEDNIVIKLPDGTEVKKRISVVHSTYHDNPFCTPERKVTHENLKRVNEYYYKVYTLGLWGKKMAGGEALKCFSAAKHLGHIAYNPNLALHLSFDENVVPYFPCGIFQIEGKKVYMIDEIAATNPNNKVSYMTEEITRKCLAWQHKAGMFIYGDATSQKEDVKQLRGHDLFQLLIIGLRQFHPVRRVANSNPSVAMSLNFFNTVLELEFNGISFLMDEKCKVARNDFENAKESAEGGIDKRTVQDTETKQRYQEYGHMIDLIRYLLCFAFNGDYINYQRGGLAQKIRVKVKKSNNSW